MKKKPDDMSCLLTYLLYGGREEAQMRFITEWCFDKIRAREDCSDFVAAYCLCAMLKYRDVIPEGLFAELRDLLLDFPCEDCGGHEMCTWSENHRLYFEGIEYLLGVHFPDAVFGDGKTASEHRQSGLKKLKSHIGMILSYGFSEWCSCNYYPETIAGLSNIILFTPDDEPELKGMAKEALCRLFDDILSQTVVTDEGYIYNPATARAYVDNKVSAEQGNYLEVQIAAALGKPVRALKEKEAAFIILLESKDGDGRPLFEIPGEIRQAAYKTDTDVYVTQGLDLDLYGREGLLKYTHENVRYAMAAGAMSDYRTISNMARYAGETGLVNGRWLKFLKPLTNPILCRTGLLKLIKRFVRTPWDGSAMECGRVHTYKGDGFSMSVANDYRVGEYLFQQNPAAINISYDISLFANAPSKDSSKTGAPDYWIGSRSAPMAVLRKNMMFLLFDRPSHMFFPTGLFDELDLSDITNGRIYGRKGDIAVSLVSNPGCISFADEGLRKKDMSLRQDGKIADDLYCFDYDLINSAKKYSYYLVTVEKCSDLRSFAGKLAGVSVSRLDRGRFEISGYGDSLEVRYGRS